MIDQAGGRRDTRALARAISAIEAGVPVAAETLRELAGDSAPHAHVVGLTGPPGSGKSTLGDALIEAWRAAGRTVAILAVDPSSPFTGGAILGDRVRMQRHATDRDVFIRSMGARGHLGGLASATRATVRLLDTAGWDVILLETVGVGQSELEVCGIADTVAVVTTPTAGDGVQIIKAGIMEIGDLFVVNKADLEGAARTVREIRDLIRARPAAGAAQAWTPMVLATIAVQQAVAVRELVPALDQHRAWLAATGQQVAHRQQRLLAEVLDRVRERAGQAAQAVLAAEGVAALVPDADPRAIDPDRVASVLLQRIGAGAAPTRGSAPPSIPARPVAAGASAGRATHPEGA
ncbi:MAG TPA: methylmalonyl Co-A mutase-associated GTPase MeaB [Candidatus Dormibacteraeota bacterium]|nr:methylmalonyl Co-A mutase-associated GTPase MeaB [Candidatus Dormibacteraeota bacterium]